MASNSNDVFISNIEKFVENYVSFHCLANIKLRELSTSMNLKQKLLKILPRIFCLFQIFFIGQGTIISAFNIGDIINKRNFGNKNLPKNTIVIHINTEFPMALQPRWVFVGGNGRK